MISFGRSNRPELHIVQPKGALDQRIARNQHLPGYPFDIATTAHTSHRASLRTDHAASNLSVLFPASVDPGLARLIFDQTVNRSVAELLQVESLKGY